jgi:hypothetical protein
MPPAESDMASLFHHIDQHLSDRDSPKLTIARGYVTVTAHVGWGGDGLKRDSSPS